MESRRGYTGKVISLDVDTVRFPDGSFGSTVMRPTDTSMKSRLEDSTTEKIRVIVPRAS